MSKQQQAPGELERVREFVNTADLEDGIDELDSPQRLADWLAAHRLADRGLSATSGDLLRAVELREALRAILLAHTAGEPAPTGACATLTALAERARLRLRFGTREGATLEPGAPGVDGSLGRMLAIVHAAAADGTWPRLKACREQRCEWAFYDHTKNRSGAWCNMAVCGNRAKARAYRERRGAAEPA